MVKLGLKARALGFGRERSRPRHGPAQPGRRAHQASDNKCNM